MNHLTAIWSRLFSRASSAETGSRATSSDVSAVTAPGYRFGACGSDLKIGHGVEIIGPTEKIFIGDRVRIEDGVRIVVTDSAAEIRIGNGTVLQPRAILETGPGGKIHLGRQNSVNPYCVIYGHGGLVTGEYVRIAAHTVIIPANHVFTDPDKPISRQGLIKRGIKIGNDVWIASGCRILDGVEIGDGCVIAAGAVVNRDVRPFSVVAGVPAKVVKMRKSDTAQADAEHDEAG